VGKTFGSCGEKMLAEQSQEIRIIYMSYFMLNIWSYFW